MSKTSPLTATEKNCLQLLKTLIKKHGGQLSLQDVADGADCSRERARKIMKQLMVKKKIRVWQDRKLPYHNRQMVEVL